MVSPVAGETTAPPITRFEDSQLAEHRARDTGRPLITVYGAGWCEASRKLKKVLATDRIRRLAGNFVWLAIDIERNMSLARDREIEVTPTLELTTGQRHQRMTGLPSVAQRSARKAPQGPENNNTRNFAAVGPR